MPIAQIHGRFQLSTWTGHEHLVGTPRGGTSQHCVTGSSSSGGGVEPLENTRNSRDPPCTTIAASSRRSAVSVQFAVHASASADIFFVVGTSAVVRPAADLPAVAAQRGAFVVEVNPEPSDISSWADATLVGKAGEILPLI